MTLNNLSEQKVQQTQEGLGSFFFLNNLGYFFLKFY